MGQNFRCVTEDEFGIKKYSTTWYLEGKYEMYVGRRLMGHSYIGNSYTDYVSHSLYHHPMRVAWVGDYAHYLPYEYVKRLNPQFPIVKEAYSTFLKEALEGDEIEIDIEKGEFNYNCKYLVNYSKKEYLSFEKYIKKIKDNYDPKYWIIYPISLLTAIGNDLGDGGYYGRAALEVVGTWTYDLLSIEDEVPKGYKEKLYCFFED